jgi:hypothetical protein
LAVVAQNSNAQMTQRKWLETGLISPEECMAGEP